MTADMSDACEKYIRMMVQGVPRVAFQYVSQLQDQELFRALAIPAREEITDLFEEEPEAPSGFDADIPGEGGAGLSPSGSAALAAASMGGQVLSRMPQMIYAYQVVMSGKQKFAHDAAPPTPEADAWAKNYVHQCVTNRAIPLNTLNDLTDSLPATAANPATLSDADYTAAAATLGVDVPAMKAVADVESAGSGFGDDGRPTIRYELHEFQENTNSQFHKTHPYLSQPTLSAGKPYHNKTQDREYSMLYNAMLLKYKGGRAIEEAIKSASWGKFQVMGDNWSDLGWSSALAFASDMYVSEANHLKAFVKFVQFNGLAHALKLHHWATFAAGYNGKAYQVNQYDTRLQQAFNRYAAAAAAHP
jgi:hypothetical protein